MSSANQDLPVPDVLVVAPREIQDLVFRACRVRGCDAGVAKRIAANIAFAEVHHGQGLALLTASIGDEHVVPALVSGPDQIAAAEVLARSEHEVTIELEPALPFGAIAYALHDAARRGVVPARPINAASTDLIGQLDLRSGGDAPDLRERLNQVNHDGVRVDASQWECIAGVAAEFLVAEAVLDAD